MRKLILLLIGFSFASTSFSQGNLYKNSQGKFSIWIATYDVELTIGLEDVETNNSNCHTHMSFYGNEPNEQLEAMSKYLENIFSDKLVFYHSTLSGFSWTYDIEETRAKKKE